jgi:putative membrane protein
MMWYGWNGGWGSWIGGAIMMLLFWGGLFFLLAWIIPGSRREHGEKSAGDILRERFARGEIDEEEFESRSRILREGGS